MPLSISDPPGLSQPTLRAHSKAKLKSNGDKASPCIRPFCTRQIFAYLDFTLFHLNTFLLTKLFSWGCQTQWGYYTKTSLLTESHAVFLFINSWGTVPLKPHFRRQIRQQPFLYSCSSYKVCYQLQLHEWNETLFPLTWWLFFVVHPITKG